jgi:hypothetical protein
LKVQAFGHNSAEMQAYFLERLHELPHPMAARIVSLARVQPAPPPVPLGLPEQVPARQQIWRGASGRIYVHSVYGLIECPPLPKASYVLVRREADGSAIPVHVGLGQEEAATLNLARVRQRGAQLGANEVHVYFAADTDAARVLAICDLRAGQLGGLAATRERPPVHAGH